MFSTRDNNVRYARVAIYSVFTSVAVLVFGAFVEIDAQARQLSLADILIALRSKKAVIEEKNRILADAVKDRGITFALTPEIEKELATTGAYPILIDAIRVKVSGPKAVDVRPAEAKPTVPVAVAQPTFESYRQSATKHLEKGAIELAIADLNKAIDLRPTDQHARIDRAKALVSQEKYEAAMPDLDKAVETEPRSVWLELRGQVNEKLKRVDAAMADYKRAVELDAGNQSAASSMKRIEIENRKPEPVKVEPAKTEPVAVEVKTQPVMTEAPAGPPDVGPLNLFATRLSQPMYTALNRQLGLQGKVVVLVTLDENGKVLKAEASTGPRQLRTSAEDAVKRSKFDPVIVEGVPSKVTGYITFNFVK